MKQVSQYVSLVLCTLAVALPALSRPAAAQPATSPTPPATSAAPAATKDTPSANARAVVGAAAPVMSLGAVLEVAVRQQPALVQASIDADIADAAVMQAAGARDWVVDATGRASNTRSRGVDRTFGVPYEASVTSYDVAAGISKLFGIGGTLSVEAGGTYRKQDITTELGTTDGSSTVYDTSVSATYAQPLLRGRGERIGLAADRQAVLRRDAAWLARQSQAALTVQNVVEAYWDLVLATSELTISQNSLDLANERLRNTEIAIRAGSVAATEALAVQQTIALREEDVLVAGLAISQRSLALRRQSGMEIGPGNIDLQTSASLGITPRPFDIDALVARAYAQSPQLAQLDRLEKGAAIEVELTENGLLPALDFALTLGTGGSDASASTALEQTARLDNPSITASLTWRQTLGNNAGHAAHRRARAELYKQRVDADDVRAQIASALVLAAKQAQAAQKRAELSQRAVELAEKNIAAEQSRFELGRATNFDVLQRQDELRQAQLRKARATVDYLRAVAAIDSITGDILPKYGILLEP